MRWMRRVGLCVMVVSAVGAVAAASALAKPTRWQVCEKAPKFNRHDTGKYTESNCATKSETSEGEYELNPWQTGDIWTFKMKSATSVFYGYRVKNHSLLVEPQNSAGIVWKLECAKDKGSAEITYYEQAWLQATFSKCTATHEPEGAPEKCKGKLETGKLDALLGSGHANGQYLGHDELQTLEEYPTPLASITCGSTTFDVTGGLGDPEIAEPAQNACAKTMTLSFRVDVGPEFEGTPFEGTPVPYESWPEPRGWPFTMIGEEVFGTGLESTETLTRKGGICVAQGFPEG
jgi:hypothetical protein